MLCGRGDPQRWPAVTPTLAFTGTFKIWTYTVSHSVLLLRQPKASSEAGALQTDIMFLCVDALCLPTKVVDPVIRFVDLPTLGIDVREQPLSGTKGFALAGPGWSGWVHALRMAWCRSPREFFEPSPMEEARGGDYKTEYFPA